MFSKNFIPSPPSSPPPQYSPSLTQAPIAPSKSSYCFWSRSLTVKDIPSDLNRDNKDENPSSSIVRHPLSPRGLPLPWEVRKFQLGSRRSALEIFKEIPPQTITLPFSSESWPGTVFSFSTTVTSDKIFLSNLPHLRLLSVVHRKRKVSGHKDDYLHMQVFNPSTNVVLHVVTQRLGAPEIFRSRYDKLHILCQADIADYSSGKEVCAIVCHRDAFSDSCPRFRDVIEVLSAACKFSASERVRYNSHSFITAAGILIIEDVCCTTPVLYTKRGSKRSRKGELESFVTAFERSFYGDRFRALRVEEYQDDPCPIIKAISGCLSRFAITLGLCE